MYATKNQEKFSQESVWQSHWLQVKLMTLKNKLSSILAHQTIVSMHSHIVLLLLFLHSHSDILKDFVQTQHGKLVAGQRAAHQAPHLLQ